MKKAITRIIIAMVITAVTAGLAACSNNTVYSEYKDIPLDGWHKDSTLVWQVDITDTTAAYNVIVSVRHGQRYPFQNMWFFLNEVKIQTDSLGLDSLGVAQWRTTHDTLRVDTLEYYLADQRGHWLGNGFGDKKEMPCLIGQNVRFAHPGVYTYFLRHGMREDELLGISEVGLMVEKQ